MKPVLIPFRDCRFGQSIILLFNLISILIFIRIFNPVIVQTFAVALLKFLAVFGLVKTIRVYQGTVI